MNKELDLLYEMIADLDTAMLTTRRPDGHLVSRAMANQKHAPGADLWFVTSESTHKLDELANDPHVNLAYYQDRTREWISVAGIARTSRDLATIKQLYAPDWKIWFPDEGDPRHGTPDDPRMLLIGVRADSAHFMTLGKPQPVVLFEMLKARLMGEPAEVAETQAVTGSQMRGR